MIPEEIELSFEANEALYRDLRTFWDSKFKEEVARVGRISRWLWFCLIIGLILFLDFLYDHRNEGIQYLPELFSVIVGMMMAFAIWGLVYLEMSIARRRFVKRLVERHVESQNSFGPTMLFFSSWGVTAKTNSSSENWKWAEIDDIKCLQSGILILRGTQAMPLPKNAIPQGTTIEQFHQHLRELKAAAA